MPKRVFWPATLLTMGLILIASNLGLLPAMFWNLWPIMLIIVGLGGLVISDREDWERPKNKSTKKTVKKAVKKKKKATAKKKR